MDTTPLEAGTVVLFPPQGKVVVNPADMGTQGVVVASLFGLRYHPLQRVGSGCLLADRLPLGEVEEQSAWYGKLK